jgi:hypothetical protein
MTARDERPEDDELLVELGEALPDPALAERVARAGRAAYAWRTVDAELASLAYDSGMHDAAAGARSEEASVRTLSFESGSLLIELAVADGRLVGQLLPAASYRLALHQIGRDPVEIAVDDLGCFNVTWIPRGPFSLRIETAEGRAVATGWVTL